MRTKLFIKAIMILKNSNKNNINAYKWLCVWLEKKGLNYCIILFIDSELIGHSYRLCLFKKSTHNIFIFPRAVLNYLVKTVQVATEHSSLNQYSGLANNFSLLSMCNIILRKYWFSPFFPSRLICFFLDLWITEWDTTELGSVIKQRAMREII